MKPMFTDEEAQESTLQELMDLMGKMDAKRAAPGVTIEISADGEHDDPEEEEGGDGDMGLGGDMKRPGEPDLSGMDPRLAEILRKKRTAGY